MPGAPTAPDPRDPRDPRDPHHPRTLLCERCGYVIEGLPTTGPCPECAEPIEASLPERRTGSAWQQRATPRSWLATCYHALRSPVQLMRAVRVSSRSSRLALLNIAVASLCAAAAFATIFEATTINPGRAPTWTMWPLIGEVWRAFPGTDSIVELGWPGRALYAWPIIGALFLLGTAIEARGIAFIGKRRRWRLRRDVCWTVCAHASCGWIVGSILCWVVLAASAPVLRAAAGFTDLASAQSLVQLWAAMLCVGLLVFETLVYIGMRQCRFANAPREPLNESR